MIWLLDAALSLAALPVLAAALYLAVLALLSRRGKVPPPAVSQLRFAFVVPAHDEERGIEETVRNLFAVDYPSARFDVVVVADNCSDETAARAAAAGARVLVRQRAMLRGKGYALAHAFEIVLAEGFADAVVVVDADTVVARNLLSALASRFEAGASVVQADYGVRNPLASWRTRLMTIALAAFHGVRSLARQRLQLSCGLRGNGMAFRAAVLRAHPPHAFSIVEDLEYGIQLGLAGVRVEYAHEAQVLGYMAASESASRSQRRRWERGRRAIMRQHARRLLSDGWKRRDWMLIDLALDLLVAPLGQLAVYSFAGLATSLGLMAFGVGVMVSPLVWAVSLAAIVTYGLRGLALSGVGAQGLLDLLWAPVYLIWKMSLRFQDRGRRPKEWVRTAREVRS